MTLDEYRKIKIRKPKTYPEDDLQMACIEWFDLAYPKLSKLLFHVPNQRKQDVIKGARLKKMGLRSGVADLILLIPKGRYHGMCIEMKSTKGKLSDNQKEWLQQAKMNDYFCSVCYDFDSFKIEIEIYLRQLL